MSVFRAHVKVKVKWSRYRSGVVQTVGRGRALFFYDRGTRRGWVVSSTPRPHFTPGKDPVPILQEAGWSPGSVWTGGKSRRHRDSIPFRWSSWTDIKIRHWHELCRSCSLVAILLFCRLSDRVSNRNKISAICKFNVLHLQQLCYHSILL